MLAFRTALNSVASSSGDPYFANVSLLMHMDGTNGGTSFPDNSSNAFSVTASGNAQTNTATVKYGTASAYFDGVGDRLTVGGSNTNAAFAFGSGNFTIESWIYTGTFSNFRAIATKYIAGTGISVSSWQFLINGSTSLLWFTFGVGTSEFSLSGSISGYANAWHHAAIVRSGSTFTLYWDGTSIGTATNAGSLNSATTANVLVGQRSYNGGTFDLDFSGYIDEFRITKGVARYTANFTPPSGPFPNN